MSQLHNNRGNGGVGLLGLLGTAFVVLKLIGTINWSWWYVTAPFWGGIALWVVLGTLAVVLMTFGRK
jgi:hypothetical protein